MKITYTISALFAFVSAVPLSSDVASRQTNACHTPAILDANTNIFLNRTLHPHSVWRNQTLSAAQNIVDKEIQKRALKASEIGTFVWIEKPEDISRIVEEAKDVPCNHTLGLLLTGLPYKKCPSIGIPPTADPWSYEDVFLKPIVRAIQANPTVAFTVIVEPFVIGEIVANLELSSCAHVRRSWRQNVPLALRSLDLPNVVLYLDAAHGGWLGWKELQNSAAKEIANTWLNAGPLKQFRGVAVNVASYNAWDMTPGEMFEGENTCYDLLNPARNEQRHLTILTRNIRKLNITMPLHGIMDTSRNGQQGVRRKWSEWCNVGGWLFESDNNDFGAGFGVVPSSNTKDANLDAFVWAKNGGVSDGTSDPTSRFYDSGCGEPTSMKHMPERGGFSPLYFEILLRNARPRDIGSKRSVVAPHFVARGAQMCG
ncbi:glycoside hydrolase family 6 protein [Lentithecium fluviatile CBS 122367]|uniref:Glucanase n=1 Tax=Lentithecium fluviatile CBS 122367 TaxID=1168545 RepID=A0A6G1J3U7_9PLEO|nr:glycoside hydrolase family 6 protein [Lentithecium fluviatile CBS 122367]